MALIVADRLDSPFDEVAGPAEHVGTFAQLWSQATGMPHHRSMRERIFRATRVVPPRVAPGSLRVAGPADADVIAAWLTAFAAEALGETSVPDAATRVERWLSPSDERTLLLWDDAGPVAMAGLSGPTPTGIRIGPVYTPPERRRRGYAGNLVAAASQRELDAGRRACFLYTDLANPTSNHIYESIGYEPVRDFDQYVFG
jgi:predicted GNAT family acetyltransferase